jgi:hypothetical protein
VVFDDRDIAVIALWQDLGEQIKDLAGSWTVYSAIGGFALYLTGYLSLRSRLTTLGVAPDLPLFDDRYFYAGADFLLYMSTTIPVLLLITIILAILLSIIAAFLYVPYRILPQRIKGTVRGWVSNPWRAMGEWWGVPYMLDLTGIVLAVAIIQLLMRQAFVFSNRLLESYLPSPGWLRFLLLGGDGALLALYFSGLVAGIAVTGGLFFLVRSHKKYTSVARPLTGILAFLLAMLLLLLPINHGILISAFRPVPRVMSLDGEKELEIGHEAWMIWEGKEWVTYFVRRMEKDREQRRLISLRHHDVKKIEIIAYEPILHILFREPR